MNHRSEAMEKRRETFLDGVNARAASILREFNIDETKADIAASEIIAYIVADFGGENLYIPKDYQHKSSLARAMTIYNACNGRNYHEVAKQFDVCVRTVYRIYNRMRRLIIDQNQRDMFN